MTRLLLFLLTMTQLHAIPLVDAIAQVESSGDPTAVGDDGRAFGLLQITKPVVLDINKHYGLKWRHEQAFEPTYARLMFEKYLAIWATEERLGRPVTDEDRARIWRGGPNGWRSERTLGYWEKVKAVIENNK